MFSTPASLLDRLREPQDLAAWDQFADLYSPLLFHWAKRLGHQSSDASDLVQDVFLILFRQLPDFRYAVSKSFRAWLKTVFMNRARQRWRTKGQEVDNGKFLDEAADAADTLDEQEYRDYLLHRVFELIQREFSPVQQAAFREYVVAERPVGEVASELGLRPGAVYCIKSRVLHRLRQELRHLLD